MADFGNVTIKGCNGEDVYINGDYSTSAGKAPGPFVVPFVYSIFDTLDAKRRINRRGFAQPTPSEPDVSIALSPVNPPVPVS